MSEKYKVKYKVGDLVECRRFLFDGGLKADRLLSIVLRTQHAVEGYCFCTGEACYLSYRNEVDRRTFE